MPGTAPRRIPSYHLYGEAPHAHDERTLHVEPVEARSARHHWKIDPHRHRALHQLVLVQRGRGVALAEGNAWHFTPPTVAVVPAGAVHGFEFEPGTLGTVVTLADELLQDLARREPGLTTLFKEPVILELKAGTPRTQELLRAARQLAHEFSHLASCRTLALEGGLAVLLAQVLRASHAMHQQDSPLMRHRQLVARFRNMIEGGFRASRSIPQYARELRVSESQLRGACLSTTGEPPLHLLHARMMLEAKRQLYYTARPVSEIAYEMGFDDPAYFTRFFARRAGMSPRAFRTRSPR